MAWWGAGACQGALRGVQGVGGERWVAVRSWLALKAC